MAAEHCLLLRKSLQQATPSPCWPAGLTLRTLEMSDAAQAFELLRLTNHEDLLDWPTWQAQWQGNSEYDRTLCLLVLDTAGLVALVQGWTSAYIKDLAVHPRARHQGLGRALLAWAFEAYRQRGEAAVDLRVRESNAAALRLYGQMGLQVIRREPC